MKQQCEAVEPTGEVDAKPEEKLLSVQEIMAGLDDIIEVSGPIPEGEIQESKIVNEKNVKQQQSTLAFKKKEKPTLAPNRPKVASHTSVTGDEESEGLEFIDPEAEKRANLAEAAKERDEKQQMIVINGQLMPAHSVPG